MSTANTPAGTAVDGRTRHYGTFYGLDDPAPADGASPLLLVWGNCQAEAMRVLLSGSATLGATTVRIPPVFELTAADMGPLRRLAERASLLVTQPVKDNYRDLPLGSDQLAAMMPAGSTVIRWPVVRWSGLHPCQVIVRDPRDDTRDPPVVPYHDLRTLASARRGEDLLDADISAAACRTVADASTAELQRREQRQCDVMISDLFAQPRADDMATINHPGNRVLIELARRIQQALGRHPDAADPGRILLGEVVAPVIAPAATAMKVPATETAWRVGGNAVSSTIVHRTQWQWYLDNPWVLEAGYARHLDLLDTLGLA